MKDELVALIDRFHKDRPMKKGMDRRIVKNRLLSLWDHRSYGLLLEEISNGGIIGFDERYVFDKEHESQSLESAPPKALNLESTIAGSGLKSVSKGKLLEDAGMNLEETLDAIAWLLRSGKIIELAEGLYMGVGPLDTAIEKLYDLYSEYNEIGAATYRDALNTNRKTAVALLEYFDKQKITMRRGDVRLLRKK